IVLRGRADAAKTLAAAIVDGDVGIRRTTGPVNQCAVAGNTEGSSAESGYAAHAVRHRKSVTRKLQPRWIEGLRQKRLLAQEEQIAGRRKPRAGVRRQNLSRLARPEHAGIDALAGPRAHRV